MFAKDLQIFVSMVFKVFLVFCITIIYQIAWPLSWGRMFGWPQRPSGPLTTTTTTTTKINHPPSLVVGSRAFTATKFPVSTDFMRFTAPGELLSWNSPWEQKTENLRLRWLSYTLELECKNINVWWWKLTDLLKHFHVSQAVYRFLVEPGIDSKPFPITLQFTSLPIWNPLDIWRKQRKTSHGLLSFQFSSSTKWWFQPIWKILVKLDHFPRDRGENQKYWNHHLVIFDLSKDFVKICTLIPSGLL